MKLPLKISRLGYLVDADGRIIGRHAAPADDLEFINIACNAHEDLLKLAKRALAAINGSEYVDAWSKDILAKELSAAIKKATEGT